MPDRHSASQKKTKAREEKRLPSPRVLQTEVKTEETGLPIGAGRGEAGYVHLDEDTDEDDVADAWCQCTLCGKHRIIPLDEQEALEQDGEASCTTILEACGRVGDCRTPLEPAEEGNQD